MSGDQLSSRALSRATLARQFLLQRTSMSAYGAIEHLVGMQAQTPKSPYVGLWSRLDGFQADELAGLLVDRQVVRIALMRSTIHLVTADDCLTLRPFVQPALERMFKSSPFARATAGVDRESLLAAGRALVEEQPRTTTELGNLLQVHWPECDPAALHQAMRTFAPLVQVPPRGVWGSGGQVTLTTTETWLGRPLVADPAPETFVLRYLAAYGPASVKDMQAWSGVTRLREVFERLRPGLVTFRNESGVELFDLPEAPRPNPDTSAPVRFLPDYDNVLLGFSDRTRFIAEADKGRNWSVNGQIPGTLLVDGFVGGTWKITREKDSATLSVAPYRAITAAERADIEFEGEGLLLFTAGETATRDVRIAPFDPRFASARFRH